MKISALLVMLVVGLPMRGWGQLPEAVEADFKKQALAACAELNAALLREGTELAAQLVQKGEAWEANEVAMQIEAEIRGDAVLAPPEVIAERLQAYETRRAEVLRPLRDAAVRRLVAMLQTEAGKDLTAVVEIGRVRDRIAHQLFNGSQDMTAGLAPKLVKRRLVLPQPSAQTAAASLAAATPVAGDLTKVASAEAAAGASGRREMVNAPGQWEEPGERAAAPVRPSAMTPSLPAAVAARDGFANTLGMRLVPVPGTRVLMCIHETRYQDYAAFVKENPGRAKDWQNQKVDGISPEARAPEHPVMRVSWVDAQAFCSWLGQREARIYRLPTDREWSCAVGLGDVEKDKDKGAAGRDSTPEALGKKAPALWPWGTTWPPPQDAGNYADLSRLARKLPPVDGGSLENYNDGFPTTAPVMSFKPNQLGIYDLGGNVWEWCQDLWNAESKERVTRSGSFADLGKAYLQSARRGHHTPETRLANHGFRIVVELPEGR